MSTVQDADIGIWVCPHGYSADVLEFAIGGPEPTAEGCPTHGEPYVNRCPKADCPSPVYHPGDLDANYHKPCRTKIPWAETRSAAAQALMEHDPFTSKLLGTKKRDYGFENFVRRRYFPGENVPESLPVRHELTPEERQDLINPPSGRLPAESIRTPEPKGPPRVTPSRGTGGHLSEPDLVPKPRDMSQFMDREGTLALREIEKNQAEAAKRPPKPSRKSGEPSWWHRGIRGFATLVFLILVGAGGTIVAAYLMGWLKAIGLAPPQ